MNFPLITVNWAETREEAAFNKDGFHEIEEVPINEMGPTLLFRGLVHWYSTF